MKLNLGSGKDKREGFISVDVRQFEGVDVVCDLGKDRWPWGDCTVSEAFCSHLVEHLTPAQRIHFVNELWRVMKPGAKAVIIVPHWNSCRAYGDLTHQWPPVSEFWFPYLDKVWREQIAPHCDEYMCNFAHTVGYSPHPELQARSPEHVAFALGHYRESAQDMMATLEAKR